MWVQIQQFFDLKDFCLSFLRKIKSFKIFINKKIIKNSKKVKAFFCCIKKIKKERFTVKQNLKTRKVASWQTEKDTFV